MNNKPVAWMLVDKQNEYIRSIMAVQHDFVPEGCVEIPLYTHPVKELYLSLQKEKETGELLAVTYTDDEHRIVEVLWEKPPVKEQGNPVAWRSQSPDGYWSLYGAPVEGAEPLYTGFKELTDEELAVLIAPVPIRPLYEDLINFARAILRKAQEK